MERNSIPVILYLALALSFCAAGEGRAFGGDRAVMISYAETRPERGVDGARLSRSANAMKESETVTKVYETPGAEHMTRDGRRTLSIFNEMIAAALAVAAIALIIYVLRRK